MSDPNKGIITVTMRPSQGGNSAWFFTPCAENTTGIFPADSGKKIGAAQHSFSCRLLGESTVTQFNVFCAGRLGNYSAMCNALNPNMPFFQISLECSK